MNDKLMQPEVVSGQRVLIGWTGFVKQRAKIFVDLDIGKWLHFCRQVKFVCSIAGGGTALR